MNTTTTSTPANSGTRPLTALKPKGKQAKVPKPKRAIVLGIEGVEQVEALCDTLQATVGFRPTAAQAITWLISKHTPKVAAESAASEG